MPSLKSLLLFDAATCAVMGLALIAGAPLINSLTDIPAGFALAAGVLLLPIAVFMAIVARRYLASPAAVWLIVAGNAGWVAASLLVIATGLIRPNEAGNAFILAQAAAVALLALLEWAALRGRRTRDA